MLLHHNTVADTAVNVTISASPSVLTSWPPDTNVATQQLMVDGHCRPHRRLVDVP